MKNKFQSHLFLITILFGLFFSGCEKEPIESNPDSQTQNVYTIKQYTLKEASKLPQFISAQQEFNTILNAAADSVRYANDYHFSAFSVDESTVKEVTSTDYTSYTLRVIRPNPTPGYFENVVIEIYRGKARVYLLKYTPTRPIKYLYEDNTFTFQVGMEKYAYPTCIMCPGDGPSIPGDTGGGSTNCVVVLMCNWGGTEHVAGPNCEHTYSVMFCGVIGGQNPGTVTGPGGGGSSGGGNGSSPLPPQGTVTVPVAPPPPTPCEELLGLTNPTKANIKPSIDWLKGKVNEPLEYGVEFEKSVTGTYTNTNVNASGIANAVPLSYGGDIYGGAHIHTLKGQPIFSFGDVTLLNFMYSPISTESNRDATLMLICRTSLVPYEVSTYALKVDDIVALKAGRIGMYTKYGDIEADKRQEAIQENERMYYDRFNETYQQMGNANYEIAFLQRYGSYGISLYKADENLENWSKLKLTVPNPLLPNNVVITQIPCNIQ